MRLTKLKGPRDLVWPEDDALDIPPTVARAAFPAGEDGDRDFAAAAANRKAWEEAWATYERRYDLDALVPWTRPGCELAVFKIISLPEAARSYIDTVTVGGTKGGDAGAYITETIAYGLVAVKGLDYDDGRDVRPVELETEETKHGRRLTKRSLDFLVAPELRMWLVVEIQKASGISKETRKSG